MLSLERITFDPQVKGGRACIRGMRITVLNYAAWLADESVYTVERVSA